MSMIHTYIQKISWKLKCFLNLDAKMRVDFEFSRQFYLQKQKSSAVARKTNVKWIQLIFTKKYISNIFYKNYGEFIWKRKEISKSNKWSRQSSFGKKLDKEKKNMWNWRIIPKHLSLTFFQELKKQRDQLHKYQKRIELSLEKDRTLAKKLLSEGKKEWVFDLCESFLNN